MTQTGFSVVAATSARSRARGPVRAGTAPVSGHTITPIRGSADQGVEDAATAFVHGRGAAAVDRVVDAEVARDALVQGGERRRAEPRHPQPGRARQIGEVGAAAARDAVDAEAGRGGGPAAGEERGHLLELVEPVDPGHPVLAEHPVHDPVAPGQVTGVGPRHRTPRRRSADLHHHERDATGEAVVERELECPPVGEALDVGGDRAHLGLVGEPGGEVGELEVGLVAGRRPVRHARPRAPGPGRAAVPDGRSG